MTPKEGQDDVDWDALYGDEDEEDVDMKSHGSVITHLLSQVRIGMDLTKIGNTCNFGAQVLHNGIKTLVINQTDF